jgi:quinoprotein glucose dehydrogenase
VKSASIYTPPSKRGVIATPGFHGGSNWSGASFDPVRGRLVANSNDVPFLQTMRDARFWVSYRYGFTGFLPLRRSGGLSRREASLGQTHGARPE